MPAGFSRTRRRMERPLATRETIVRLVALAGLSLAGAGLPTAALARLPVCDAGVPHPARCKRAAAAAPKTAEAGSGRGHPAIEVGGTSPAIDAEMALLKPGMFRLDMSGYYASYLSNPRGNDTATAQGAFLLGYGFSPRLTVFAGAIESNRLYPSAPVTAEYLAPKVGFVVRVANAPQLFGNTLDLVTTFAGNQVLKPPIPSPSPYGDIGSTLKSRLVATREMGHGLTLQASAGLQAAFVEMHDGPWAGEQTYLNALAGLAAQYRLSPISDRLYLVGEVDWLKPLTDDGATRTYAAPFGTLESYSTALGATYVIRPQSVIVRLLDTVAYDKIDEAAVFAGGPHHVVTNTVGLTLSVLGHAPSFAP